MADRPRLRTADAVVSAAAIVVAAVVVAIGVAAGVFLLTVRGGGAGAVLTGLVVAVAAGIGGSALVVSRLVRRRTAWPYALATLLVCLAAVVLGGVVSFAAA